MALPKRSAWRSKLSLEEASKIITLHPQRRHQEPDGWMDPRYIRTCSWTRASLRELDRPRMWPYWHALPPKGTIGVVLNSWYEGPVADYFVKRVKRSRMRAQIEEINDFEQILSDEGALILKFLFLLPRKQNAQVYRKLRKDPDAAWKVSDYEIEIGKHLAKRSRYAHAVIEEVISATSADHAPWIPLASADRRHGDLTIGQTLRDAIVSRLQQPAATGPDNAAPAILGGTGPNVLDSLDLSISLERDRYSRQLKKEQRRLTKLTLGKGSEKRALVAVFEGNDAAGKGGSIRRVVKALDPRTMAKCPAAGVHNHLRSKLVRPRSRRTGRGVLLQRGCRPRF